MRECGKIWEEPDTPQMTMQYDACAMHAGYLQLQTPTHNMQYLLLFRGNKVTRTYLNMPALFDRKSLSAIFDHSFKLYRTVHRFTEIAKRISDAHHVSLLIVAN
jgi:hypothetical protein